MELERIEWVPGQLVLPGVPQLPPFPRAAARCGDRFQRSLFVSTCDLAPGHGGDWHVHWIHGTKLVFDHWSTDPARRDERHPGAGCDVVGCAGRTR